jgi:hypothetical protein
MSRPRNGELFVYPFIDQEKYAEDGLTDSQITDLGQHQKSEETTNKVILLLMALKKCGHIENPSKKC